MQCYYSWPNIQSDQYKFRIIHPDGSQIQFKTIDITLPAKSNMEIVDINKYLQYELKKAGLYLVDDQKRDVFYIEIITNPSLYRIEIRSYVCPNSLPVGWSNPGQYTFHNNVGERVALEVFDNPFSKLIGFTPGLYNKESSLSQNVPELNPNSSIIMQCSLINNHFSNNNTLYAFNASGIKFGSLLTAEPSDIQFVPIATGTYHDLTIQFRNENNEFVDIPDYSSVLIYLLIKMYD